MGIFKPGSGKNFSILEQFDWSHEINMEVRIKWKKKSRQFCLVISVTG